jgi:soluble lytic murein transglycosylase-like protein
VDFSIPNSFAKDHAGVRRRVRFGVGVLFGCVAMHATHGTAASGDIFVSNDPQQAITISNVPSDDRYVVLVRAPVQEAANLPATSYRDDKPPGRAEPGGRAAFYEAMVSAAAQETRVDPKLILAVIATESAYNPDARSSKGAQGLMQLLPGTARRYGVSNAYDPWQSILGGARYLSDLLRLFDQDVTLALAAYNAGEQAVERYGRRIPPYRETMAYVPRVLAHYRSFASRSM